MLQLWLVLTLGLFVLCSAMRGTENFTLTNYSNTNCSLRLSLSLAATQSSTPTASLSGSRTRSLHIVTLSMSATSATASPTVLPTPSYSLPSFSRSTPPSATWSLTPTASTLPTDSATLSPSNNVTESLPASLSNSVTGTLTGSISSTGSTSATETNSNSLSLSRSLSCSFSMTFFASMSSSVTRSTSLSHPLSTSFSHSLSASKTTSRSSSLSLSDTLPVSSTLSISATVSIAATSSVTATRSLMAASQRCGAGAKLVAIDENDYGGNLTLMKELQVGLASSDRTVPSSVAKTQWMNFSVVLANVSATEKKTGTAILNGFTVFAAQMVKATAYGYNCQWYNSILDSYGSRLFFFLSGNTTLMRISLPPASQLDVGLAQFGVKLVFMRSALKCDFLPDLSRMLNVRFDPTRGTAVVMGAVAAEAMAGTSLIAASSGSAMIMDSQAMAVLGMISCSAGSAQYAMESLEMVLNPVGFDSSSRGKLMGSFALIFGFGLLQSVVVLVVRFLLKQSWSDAFATARFPSWFINCNGVLYQGMSYLLMQLVFSGEWSLFFVFALVWCSLFPFVVIALVNKTVVTVPEDDKSYQIYFTRSVSYKAGACMSHMPRGFHSFVIKYLYPKGRWAPQAARKTVGSPVLLLRPPWTCFAPMVYFQALVIAIVASLRANSQLQCVLQFCVLAAMYIVASIVLLLCRPYRSKMFNFIQPLGNMLLALLLIATGALSTDPNNATLLQIMTSVLLLQSVFSAVRGGYAAWLFAAEQLTLIEEGKDLWKMWVDEPRHATLYREFMGLDREGNDDKGEQQQDDSVAILKDEELAPVALGGGLALVGEDEQKENGEIEVEDQTIASAMAAMRLAFGMVFLTNAEEQGEAQTASPDYSHWQDPLL